MATMKRTKNRPDQAGITKAIVERLDERLQRHEDMLAITFRRIADLQADVDRLKASGR
jgi:hypothetical protein